MAEEAILVGKIDEHEQLTIVNTTGVAVVAGEVINIQNAQGQDVAYIVREAIAIGASGEANILGEFSGNANSASVFAVGDDVYWKASLNKAVTRSEAKTGDFYVGMCTKAKASGVAFVWFRLNHKEGTTPLSVSASSTSVSVSTSSSSISTSSSSDSKDSKSSSSLSVSSNSDISTSSNSDSSASITA